MKSTKPLKDFGPTHKVLLVEFKHELNQYLASASEKVTHRTLQELIEFNNENERQTVLFDQSLFEQSQKPKATMKTIKLHWV